MTRLEQSEHEVHALREEIRTPPHGGPPEGMRPDSHVIGDLERKLESAENKYQLLQYAGTPQVSSIGIQTPKPEPRAKTSSRFPWGMTFGRFPSVAALTVLAPSGHPSKDPPAFPP